jgi:hypothetical protein
MPHGLRHRAVPAPSDWDTAHHVWDAFVTRHPELRYPRGRWGFHNFVRVFRQRLIEADAIRLARNRFWVAHRVRFADVAFDLATSFSKHAGDRS